MNNQTMLTNWGIKTSNIEAAIAGKRYGQKSQIAQAIEAVQDTVAELAADCGLAFTHDLKATFALIATDLRLDCLAQIVRDNTYALAPRWQTYSTDEALNAVQSAMGGRQ